MKESFTIHDLPVSERPRERLQKYGAESLSAQEILALLLGRGIAGESVIVTSQRLLAKFDDLKTLAGASLEELSHVKRLGLAKAFQIQAAFEMARRMDRYAEDDIKLTKRLADAGELMGIEVLDHIIIADNSYHSLKRAGLF